MPDLSLQTALLASLGCALALVLALPALALLMLTLAARRSGTKPAPPPGRRPPLAVLVPAHNESIHLLPTLKNLLSQLNPGDRLLVIADNCSDDTASVARQAGASVVERCDAERRGKGYALAFGVDQLRANPPEVVVIVDADCTLRPGSLAVAASLAAASAHPVQMLYLMHSPAGASLRQRMLEFAWRVKNQVRALGTERLGRACHLTGSGMAFPWAVLARAQLATGHITEDMLLGIELALAGQAPRLCASAQVDSDFPSDGQATRTQKTRWEHGHLATLTSQLPRLLGAWLRQRDAALAVLALDLLIPPLALYLLVLCAGTTLMTAACLLWPALLPAAALLWAACLTLGLAVLLAWRSHGRDLLKARELLAAPLYAIWKLPLYLAYAVGKRSGWVRTQR